LVTFGPIDVIATIAPTTIRPQTRPHSSVSVPRSSLKNRRIITNIRFIVSASTRHTIPRLRRHFHPHATEPDQHLVPQRALHAGLERLRNLRVNVRPHAGHFRADRSDRHDRAHHDQTANQTPFQCFGAAIIADESLHHHPHPLHGFSLKKPSRATTS